MALAREEGAQRRAQLDFVSYAESHDLFKLFEDMTRSLVMEQPSDPIAHMRQFLQKPSGSLRVIIFGPPSPTLAQVAKQVAEAKNVVLVDREHTVRQAVEEGTDNGRKAKPFVDAGDPIPGNVLTAIVTDRLAQSDCQTKGWVLYGYPQTRPQALALQQSGNLCSHFLHFALTIQSNEDADNEQTRIYRRKSAGVLQSFSSQVIPISVPDVSDVDGLVSRVLGQLNRKPRSNAPTILRAALVGPRGAGKTTQAVALAAKYNAVCVSVDEVVQRAMARGGKIAASLRPYVERDMPLPDGIVSQLVIDRLSDKDALTRGWILDGFPLNRAQADALASRGLNPKAVFVLDCPLDAAESRICQRRVDKVTGQRYHLANNPPPQEVDPSRLVKHPNDEEDVVRKQHNQFLSFRQEIIDAFDKQAHVIEAAQDDQIVFDAIDLNLVEPLEA